MGVGLCTGPGKGQSFPPPRPVTFWAEAGIKDPRESFVGVRLFADYMDAEPRIDAASEIGREYSAARIFGQGTRST